MMQKEKELLLKDLCARLPYRVIGKCEIDASYDTSFDTIYQTHKFNAEVYGLKGDLLLVTPLIKDTDEQTFAKEEVADGVDILDFKPYLFPLSNMTNEQKKEISKRYNLHNSYGICIEITNHSEGYWDDDNSCHLQDYLWLVDWLNENHFDYKGLIEKGLTIDATGLNIY